MVAQDFAHSVQPTHAQFMQSRLHARQLTRHPKLNADMMRVFTAGAMHGQTASIMDAFRAAPHPPVGIVEEESQGRGGGGGLFT